jgi:hypothetical protein
VTNCDQLRWALFRAVALSPDSREGPLRRAFPVSTAHPESVIAVETFVQREDAERSIEEVQGDDPELASYLRIEERELEAGGRNKSALDSPSALPRERPL